MDNGNKTFHLFLIIHDQTTNYVCLTKALFTTSSHREFWSEEAHGITISATDYQSSIKLILKNYHCSWWLLLYGPFIFFQLCFSYSQEAPATHKITTPLALTGNVLTVQINSDESSSKSISIDLVSHA